MKEMRDLLGEFIMKQNEHADKMTLLLEQSEARIGQTNEMVNKLVESTNNLTAFCKDISDKYCKHLDGMAICRDKLIEQNTKLIEAVTKLEDDVRKDHEMFKMFIQAVMSKSGGDTINVH